MRSPFSAESTPILIIPLTNRGYSLRCMYIARVFFPADKSTHVALGRHAQTCGRLCFCLFLLLAKEYFSLLQTQKLIRACQTQRSGCMLHFMQLVHPFQKTSSYATVISIFTIWIRCRLNFSLLRSAIMCLRGARSAVYRPAGPLISTMDLACVEGRVSVLVIAFLLHMHTPLYYILFI